MSIVSIDFAFIVRYISNYGLQKSPESLPIMFKTHKDYYILKIYFELYRTILKKKNYFELFLNYPTILNYLTTFNLKQRNK